VIINQKIWKLFYNNFNGGPEIMLNENNDIYTAFVSASIKERYSYSERKESNKLCTSSLDLSSLTHKDKVDDDSVYMKENFIDIEENVDDYVITENFMNKINNIEIKQKNPNSNVYNSNR
jgi:hypothetical protein